MDHAEEEIRQDNQQQVADVDERCPRNHEIDQHADTDEFCQIRHSLGKIEVMVHFVDDGNEGDDDQPHQHNERRHDGRKHQGVECGVEIVFLPKFGHEVLHGGIERCHQCDQQEKQGRIDAGHLLKPQYQRHCQLLFPAKEDGSLKYAVMSDVHISVGAQRVEWTSQCVRDINKNKDIQLVIPKNNNHIVSDYEMFLSKELMKLRVDNKTLLNENNQLKILLRLNNISYEQKDANKIPNDISKSTMVRPSSCKIQMPQNNNNNINMNNNIHNNIKPLKTQPIVQPKGDNNNNIIITQDINIEVLSNIQFPNYPKVQTSPYPFSKIMGFGANSFQGLVRDHNEDRLKVILDYKINKSFSSNGKIFTPNISYFAVYDGHGGQNCCNFLQENLHTYLFTSEFFPLYPLKAIEQSFDKAEVTFEYMALDKENKRLIDKSGSCALISLIIDEWCYLSYLGDSRALYSYDSGNQLFQISRDHKPGDMKERTRIEKAGGNIYKDTRLKINGHKIKVNEKDAPGVVFPYRVTPGNLSVRLFIIIYIFLYRLQEVLEILGRKVL